MEVMRGEAHPLWWSSYPDASCREATLVACNRWRRCRRSDPLRRCRPPAPRGWWSLTRSSPTSRVSCHSRRHRLFGSDAVRQLAAPWIDLRRLRRAFLREPSPHSVMRVRHHRALARHVPSCRARALARPRIGREAALTPLPPRLSHPFATFPLRMTTPRDVAPISPVFELVRDASTSRESFRC